MGKKDHDSLALTMRLLGRTKGKRHLFVGFFVSNIVAAGATLVPVLVVNLFTEVIFPSKDKTSSNISEFISHPWTKAVLNFLGADLGNPKEATLIALAIIVFVAGTCGAIATFCNTYLSRYIGTLIIADLRQGFLSRVITLPMGFFGKRKLGDLVSRFSTDVQITFEAVKVFLMILVQQPFHILFLTIGAYLANSRLFFVTLLIIPFVVFPVAALGRIVRRRSKRSLVSLGESMESINQVLSGLRVIKAFDGQEREIERYDTVNQKWIERSCAVFTAKAAGRGIMDLVYAFMTALTLAGGGYLVLNNMWGLDSASFGSFVVAIGLAYRPIRRLAKSYSDWQESMAAAGRVFEIIDYQDDSDARYGDRKVGPLKDAIRFEGVSFHYEDGDEKSPIVLEDLNLEIPQGKVVALVGASGAGKSTIADLIFRFYNPTAGRITFDGVPLSEIDQKSLVSHMAVVSQSPFLFNTTIRENIAYGDPQASEAQIEAAARAAHIHDLIVSLPEGYDTIVGERGSSLSGGQLQRVTIARAILKDASFLLLDEATSNLDSESEHALQAALSTLLENRTALVIAHRLSTIANADKIVVLEQGRVLETGTHEELMKNKAHYYRLYSLQDI